MTRRWREGEKEGGEQALKCPRTKATATLRKGAFALLFEYAGCAMPGG